MENAGLTAFQGLSDRSGVNDAAREMTMTQASTQARLYADLREQLRVAASRLDAARIALRHTNLAPSMAPRDVRLQLDGVEFDITEVLSTLAEVRRSCTDAGRHTLRVVR